MEDLIQDFDTTTESKWKLRLEKDLKGVTFEQLQQIDDNGIRIDPFYTIEIAESNQALFQKSDWLITEQIIVKDEKVANKVALSALKCGAGALYFKIDKSNIDWEILFEGIELNYIKSFINTANSNQLATFSDYMQLHQISNDVIHFGTDTIASLVTSKLNTEFNLTQDGFIHIDGTHYYNSGTNSVLQLAYVLAHVQEYCYQLETQNTLQNVKGIQVEIAVGTAFFEEIAKLRALRQLLALLLDQYQIQIPVEVIAFSGTLYKSPFDVYSNLLRDTLSGLAAVMGGCDALCILPFDHTSNKGNDGFSQRMSINQQLLMKEESYLHQVADVSQGSFYIETLSGQLAEKAWEHFKTVEKVGGIVAYFEQNLLVKEIQAQASQLVEDYKTGKKIWIGVNKYPNATDKPVDIVSIEEDNTIVNPLSIAAHLSFDATHG